MVCSFCVYWLYYKILFSLAYPCFSCCFVNCDDVLCTWADINADAGVCGRM